MSFLLVGFANATETQRAPSLLTSMRGVIRAPLEFHKKTFVGAADSIFAVGTDTAAVNGSQKDTLQTVTYLSEDWQSLQLYVFGGSTVRLTFQIMGANLGNKSRSELTDDDFQILNWISFGSGVNGDKISTTIDSMTTAKTTIPINLYIDSAEVFKVMIIASLDQVGNTRVVGRMKQRRELR